MRFMIVFIVLYTSLSGQNAYSDRKIDMHGGNTNVYDNYNSIGGYKDGGFRKSLERSMLLDKNSTKHSSNKNRYKKK